MAKIECPLCEKKTNDYFVMNLTRVKKGIPYFTLNPVLMCVDCYTELVNTQHILRDKEFTKKDSETCTDV